MICPYGVYRIHHQNSCWRSTAWDWCVPSSLLTPAPLSKVKKKKWSRWLNWQTTKRHSQSSHLTQPNYLILVHFLSNEYYYFPRIYSYPLQDKPFILKLHKDQFTIILFMTLYNPCIALCQLLLQCRRHCSCVPCLYPVTTNFCPH